MSQEPALLDAEDTGEERIETPETATGWVAETDDALPAETEVEQEEPAEAAESTDEDTGEAEEEAEEEQPSVEELLQKDDLSTEELDRIAEKYPGLKKQLEWKQDQARDSERQRAQAEAAKRQKQQQAQSYASGQVARELAQYINQVVESGDELNPQSLQQLMSRSSQAMDQYHWQQANAQIANAINEVAPQADIPEKIQKELNDLVGKMYSGEASAQDWYAKRLEAFGEQYMKAKEPELRKQWEKERAEKQKDRKNTERLRDADSKRKGVSPTMTNGSPGGDDPDSVIDSPTATQKQKAEAFRAKWGFDLP